MQLDQSFVVPMAPTDTFAALLDLDRVTPCLPGATIIARDDARHYRAKMAIRIGPIRMSYQGQIAIVDADEQTGRATLHAEAKDAKGRGSARATMHMTVAADADSGSRVDVRTDLDLTGRVAQMGRAVVSDVATDLLGQFADNLAVLSTEDSAVAHSGSGGGAAPPPSVPSAVAAPDPDVSSPLAASVPAGPRPVPASTQSAAPPRAAVTSAPSAVPRPSTPAAKPPSAFAIFWRVVRRRLSFGSRSDSARRAR